MAVKLCLVVVIATLATKVAGHGMMLKPSNRGSLWRIYSSQPINYNDNEFFCGGYIVQHKQHGGKCGVCGDNYGDPVPRANENTGFYGNGIITATYTSGSVITTSVNLTANHLGSFSYSLCKLEDPSGPETEDCFIPLKFADGSDEFKVHDKIFHVANSLQLPAGLTCERCVLRWHYRTGNSWGICDDGSDLMGCGDQETFRSCADISIV